MNNPFWMILLLVFQDQVVEGLQGNALLTPTVIFLQGLP